MEKAKKNGVASFGCQRWSVALSQLAHADSLDEQRSRYAQIKQAWDNRQMDVVDQLMPTLSTYPVPLFAVPADHRRSDEPAGAGGEKLY